ncbi:MULTISPECIES: CBS domain-containing protein [Globicatella]|uniref:CBS domain-containing protein n=1 Tax=Globicatella sulfidifaciens TaxID=136093 RepID=A0A7X8H021_9LACT|nr:MULTISPECIES: CBS domain-containing protein [Globicatella]NLJ18026.1 CBS domain-containing protein [Globicatella sulfidifaciens]WPC09473.1 CBS domain-containing protein [Globicatella sp. PHS-GS-PNBC-21-1553]HJF16352.1 CBS domain-containing protein [Globicatella sulfidifaciens]
MYVKNYMTTNLIVIGPEASMIDANDLMKQHNINRLPVVENERLVGLITRSIIAENSPSGATSLSKFELNYLLDKTKVKDIMEKQVIQISPDHLLEEAAVIMRNSNIGVLVVSENNQIKGIITDKDIFRAFADISGYNIPGSSVVVAVQQDRRGVIEEIGDALLESDSNLTNLVVYHTEDGIRVVIHIDSDNPSDLVEKLKNRNLIVNSVQVKEME